MGSKPVPGRLDRRGGVVAVRAARVTGARGRGGRGGRRRRAGSSCRGPHCCMGALYGGALLYGRAVWGRAGRGGLASGRAGGRAGRGAWPSSATRHRSAPVSGRAQPPHAQPQPRTAAHSCTTAYGGAGRAAPVSGSALPGRALAPGTGPVLGVRLTRSPARATHVPAAAGLTHARPAPHQAQLSRRAGLRTGSAPRRTQPAAGSLRRRAAARATLPTVVAHAERPPQARDRPAPERATATGNAGTGGARRG